MPVTPAEQIESTHEAYEAGASLVHIHVRNPEESRSSDPALFAQVQVGVRKHCPAAAAANNAELVKKIVDVCDRYGRRPATVGEARWILGLRSG